MEAFRLTESIRKTVKEIMGLAIDINSDTDFCVFTNFSGHVNQFELQLKKNKEHYQEEISNSFRIYLNPLGKEDWEWEGDQMEILEKLQGVKVKLMTFLATHSREAKEDPYIEF